jgi:ceramide glucosyltransferase
MLSWFLMAVCTAATAISVVSVFWLTRRRAGPAPSDIPDEPISVLKPLCGSDEALEANLETFFVQRHPAYELIFGVERPDDPALAVVARLTARHPEVRARVVVHGQRGLNPKVANLRGMLAAGANDVVVVSDSNVAVGPDYLARLAARFADPAVGLVTSLFAGVGQKTLGATLESLHLCGPIAGSVAASEVLSGNAVVVGKSMMFRRSVLEALGGLESVSAVLAEDYVIGRMFTEAGYQVRVCADVIHNVTVRTSVRAFLRRQLRWGLLRSRIKPLLYPLEPLINPSAVALAALALGTGVAPAATMAWALGLTLLRDALQWWRLRGPRGLEAVLLGPVKDLFVLSAWAVAPFVRTVSWRGRRLRVSAGTRLYAHVGAAVSAGA